MGEPREISDSISGRLLMEPLLALLLLENPESRRSLSCSHLDCLSPGSSSDEWDLPSLALAIFLSFFWSKVSADFLDSRRACCDQRLATSTAWSKYPLTWAQSWKLIVYIGVYWMLMGLLLKNCVYYAYDHIHWTWRRTLRDNIPLACYSKRQRWARIDTATTTNLILEVADRGRCVGRVRDKIHGWGSHVVVKVTRVYVPKLC